jgi:hypothetical protein
MRWRLLERSALGQVRIELETGEGSPALPHLPVEAAGEHRQAGRELIKLLVAGLEREQADLVARADQLGMTYGELYRRYGVSLRQSLGEMGLVRGAFASTLIEYAFGVGEPTADALARWLGRVNELLDRVCLSMIEYRIAQASG